MKCTVPLFLLHCNLSEPAPFSLYLFGISHTCKQHYNTVRERWNSRKTTSNCSDYFTYLWTRWHMTPPSSSTSTRSVTSRIFTRLTNVLGNCIQMKFTEHIYSLQKGIHFALLILTYFVILVLTKNFNIVVWNAMIENLPERGQGFSGCGFSENTAGQCTSFKIVNASLILPP